MTDFFGKHGDDNLAGTTGDDTFYLRKGGEDTAFGDDGNDTYRMRDQLSAGDRLDGGNAFDIVCLHGDYTAGLVLDADTLTNIERLHFRFGNSYDITSDDGNVAAGERFQVDASRLFSGDSLTFDGGAETDGRFRMIGGSGSDNLTGGALNDRITGGFGNDTFDLTHGGDDRVHGNFGDDSLILDDKFTADDHLDGGEGFDTVYLDGDYDGANAVVFGNKTMHAVEKIVCAAGHSYDLTTDNATVDSFTNLTLIVDATALGRHEHLRFNGSHETDSNFTLLGGAGKDHLIGGLFADDIQGNGNVDVLVGGGGLDTLTGGDGHDVFRYTAAADSHSLSHDTITDFSALGGAGPISIAGTDVPDDKIDVPVSVSLVQTASGSVSFATFDSDMGTIVNDNLGAIVISVSGGDYINHTFVWIDGDGSVGYSGTGDYLIDITGFTGTVTTGNFI